MIQFNLLPDVKLDYIQARSRKRLIIGTSIIVAAVFLGLFIILFLFVRVNQTKYMADLTKDISTNVKKIQSKQDLNKILTIQNQLDTLSGLHDAKAISSRLPDYLTQILPANTTVTTITVDFVGNKISMQGQADNLTTINKFVDTLKFTDYKANDKSNKTGRAFSNVVLQSFSLDRQEQGGLQGKAGFNLVFSFDPVIFQNINTDSAQPVTLTVPNIISTRSETEKPAGLFTEGSQGR